jgi:hypothetical protein
LSNFVADLTSLFFLVEPMPISFLISLISLALTILSLENIFFAGDGVLGFAKSVYSWFSVTEQGLYLELLVEAFDSFS